MTMPSYISDPHVNVLPKGRELGKSKQEGFYYQANMPTVAVCYERLIGIPIHVQPQRN